MEAGFPAPAPGFDAPPKVPRLNDVVMTDLLSIVPALLVVLVTGCTPSGGLAGGVDADADTGVEADASPEAEPQEPAVTSCSPDHGPFTGGRIVAVRGSGFGDGACVYFAERLVPTEQTTVEDTDLITVVTPANPPGPVDVRVVVGEQEAVKEDAYTYDILHVDPPSGSIAGGTYVTIDGADTSFDPASTVMFDGREAWDVTWISATRLTCRTPPGVVGPADVDVAGEESYSVRGAYSYYNPVDPDGGLGGGPIDGSLDVSVIDTCSGEPVEDAFVMLGTGADTPWRDLTDSRGQITFSGPGLEGPQTLTAAKDDPEHGMCERTTIVGFDARHVTILLWCRPCGGSHGPPGEDATVRGEIVFDHSGGGPGPWDVVPEPGPGEEKIAFVSGSGWSIWHPRYDPTSGGMDNTVRDTEHDMGEDGYVFECSVRPGTVAVYALAGLRDTVTDTFTPYALGIARGIVAGSGEIVADVRIDMSQRLDATPEVRLDGPPLVMPGEEPEPYAYKVDVLVDLGSEGVLWHDAGTMVGHGTDMLFTFPGWPTLEGELADASYTVQGGAFREVRDEMTGEFLYMTPMTARVVRGITDVEEIVVGDFLGVPVQVDPGWDEIMSGASMEFGHGGSAPDFWYVTLQEYPDGSPVWRIILPADVTSYTLPDLSTIADLPGPPPGRSVWTIRGIEVSGRDYDEWSYAHLSRDRWSACSADVFLFRLP